MKNILNKDEIKFIKDLYHQMKNQDNRATASPYTYRILQQEKLISADMNQYDNIGVWIEEDYFDNIEDSFEYVQEYLNENKEDYHIKVKVTESNLEDILDELDIDYTYYSWTYRDCYGSGLSGGSNCFLTEKACLKFINENKHNLSNPRSFVVHEYRNPEMKKVIDILYKLGEKL